MPGRRLWRIALVAAAVAAAAAAATLLNLALLGYAQPRNDPVGKLSPRAVFRSQTLTAPTTPPPTQPTTTSADHGEGGHGEYDD